MNRTNYDVIQFTFLAGPGGPGTIFMLQSGAGVGTVLIDARGKDPKVKKTENCDQFESEASGICHINLSAGQKSCLMKQITIRKKLPLTS